MEAKCICHWGYLEELLDPLLLPGVTTGVCYHRGIVRKHYRLHNPQDIKVAFGFHIVGKCRNAKKAHTEASTG